MSSRQKRIIRDRVAARVLNGDITLYEGQSALKAAGVKVKGQKAATAAAKSSPPPQAAGIASGTVYKSYGAGLTAQQPIGVEPYTDYSSPAIREGAFQAAFQTARHQGRTM